MTDPDDVALASEGRSAPALRASGIHRLIPLAVVLAAFALMMAGALVVRRAAGLNGLPVTAEPFDLAALRGARPSPEADAFVLYKLAAGRVPPETIDRVFLMDDGFDRANDRYLRDLAALCPDGLRLFVEASDRPDGQDPDGVSLGGAVYVLARLAVAEGAGRQDEGDLTGAWTWYRAALRASRHLGQRAPLAGRKLGFDLHMAVCERIRDLGREAKVEHGLLKAAIGELEGLDAMTPPEVLTLRYEYLATIDRLARSVPGRARPESGISRPVDAFLRNEPERSRRVLRHLFTNWLDQAALPPEDRKVPIAPDFPLFDRPPGASPRTRLDPARIREFHDSSDLATWDPPVVPAGAVEFLGSRKEESIIRANLIVELAERRYLLDHGQKPEAPEGLLGLYLRQIPVDYQPYGATEVPPDPDVSPPSLDMPPPGE